MNTLNSEAKKREVYVDKINEEQVDIMFQVASGTLLDLMNIEGLKHFLGTHPHIRYRIKYRKEKE